MSCWLIKHVNDMCKFRDKGNKGYICEHNENFNNSCKKKGCPLRI